ncbi:MAG: hypothetical protein ABID87_05165 [Chloroflexota bacterium]
MECQYEVLSPWAEADMPPPRGIVPRVSDLSGATIGLFTTRKIASRPVLEAVARGLGEKYPDLKFSWFQCNHTVKITDTGDREGFTDWLKGVDTAIAAVGD